MLVGSEIPRRSRSRRGGMQKKTRKWAEKSGSERKRAQTQVHK